MQNHNLSTYVVLSGVIIPQMVARSPVEASKRLAPSCSTSSTYYQVSYTIACYEATDTLMNEVEPTHG
jgi:hypothetical protein